MEINNQKQLEEYHSFLRFAQFDKNNVYIISDWLRFGIVWRRQNGVKYNLGWIKFAWNTQYNCISSKVVYTGYNIFKGIKSLIKSWNPINN